jgi:hypothetical protein
MGATARNFDCDSDDTLIFSFSHGGAFSGRAAWHQQAHPATYLSFHQGAQAIFVDRAVSFERSNQRRRATAHPVNFHRHRNTS